MLIDELKKKSVHLDFEGQVIKLSDIEEVLSKVCRWKRRHPPSAAGYLTECKDEWYFEDGAYLNEFPNFKYCPYCGKLIEESKDNG